MSLGGPRSVRSRLVVLRVIAVRILQIFNFNIAWSDVAILFEYEHLRVPKRHPHQPFIAGPSSYLADNFGCREAD